MKTILVPIHDDAGQEARLRAATDCARLLQGHLVCIDLVVPQAAGDPFGGIAPVVTERAYLQDVSNRDRVLDRLQKEKTTADWIEAIGDPEENLVQAAALCDVIVTSVARASGNLFHPRGISDAVIVRSGRPVLAVPEECRGIDFSGEAMVAYDGSPSCIAAMRAALPLLARAASISLFEIDDGSVRIPAEDAAVYLGHHGICSHVVPKYPLLGSAGEMLVHRCHRKRPAFVVMGGYGHGRLREALFGGATRTMLRDAQVPLLLDHG